MGDGMSISMILVCGIPRTLELIGTEPRRIARKKWAAELGRGAMV